MYELIIQVLIRLSVLFQKQNCFIWIRVTAILGLLPYFVYTTSMKILERSSERVELCE